jgi:regulator of protease activity HflC (stomatin/prohibitin superfamily)
VLNIGVITVPQQQVVVVERLGKFHKMLPAGLLFCMPYPIDHMRMHDLKERPYHLAKTPGITRDNVDLIMDGVVYLRIVDAYRANYAISDPIEAMLILAQTTVCGLLLP